MNFVVARRNDGDLRCKLGAARVRSMIIKRRWHFGTLSLSDPDHVLAKNRYSEMSIVLGATFAETGNSARARSGTSRRLLMARQLASRNEATADQHTRFRELHELEASDLRQPKVAVELVLRAVVKSGGGTEYLD
jgi:hypothetical protein